jgi:hypothetical protein
MDLAIWRMGCFSSVIETSWDAGGGQILFLKSILFALAVFLRPSRVETIIKMHQETTRLPTWPLGGGIRVKKIFFFQSIMLYVKIFLFKHLAGL